MSLSKCCNRILKIVKIMYQFFVYMLCGPNGKIKFFSIQFNVWCVLWTLDGFWRCGDFWRCSDVWSCGGFLEMWWVLKVHAYTVKATANDRQCMYRPLASNKRAIYYLVGGRFLVLNLLAHLRILIEEMR